MNNKFHILIILILCFFNCYSFPLSWSVAANVLCLLVVGISGVSSGSDRQLKAIFLYSGLLLFYTLIVCMGSGEINSYTLGKPLRLLFVLVLFYFLSGKIKDYKITEIRWGLGLAFAIHLVCVYIQFLRPETKALFYSFLNSEKELVDLRLRSFGLCSSYDASGLVLCVFISLLWAEFRKSKNMLLFLLCFVAYIGCFIVSRTSMIVGSVFIVMMIISLFKKDKKFATLFVIPVFAIGLYYVYDIAQLVLEVSSFEESYRQESVEYLTGDMLILPKSTLEVILGTGTRSTSSDIGYVNIIYMIGLIGLFIVLMMYKYTYKCIKYYKINQRDIYLFMTLFLLLLLIFNYKLLLLYARGINDVYFLLLFILIRKQNSYVNENN